MRTTLRHSDRIISFSGEEFLVVLVTAPHTAIQTAPHLRQNIYRQPLYLVELKITLTMTI
jgi:PleD family two-component response regulator